MASGQTGNYQLNQWEAGDPVLREEFNGDNLAVDAALAQLTRSKGNCRIITGSYVGTGTYDHFHPCTIEFEGEPLMVFIHGDRNCWAIRGSERASVDSGSSGSTVSMTWSGNTLSWYGINANDQMNKEGALYLYTALVMLE